MSDSSETTFGAVTDLSVIAIWENSVANVK